MVMQALTQTYISFTNYLEGERDVKTSSEYVEGEIYAMTGASATHNTITHTLGFAIDNTLNDICRVWQSDMKVIGKTRDNKPFAYYPDIMAAFGKNTDDYSYYRTNPILIVEVLPSSTKRIDLKEKFDNYTQISSLLEYVVVSQETPYLRVYRRRKNWQLEPYYAENTLLLESVGLETAVHHIYRRVRREVGLDVPFAMKKNESC